MDSTETVWISTIGNSYHSSPNCNVFRKTAQELSRSEAKKRGFHKCTFCYDRYPVNKELSMLALHIDIYVRHHFDKDKIPDDQFELRKNMEFPRLLADVRARITKSKKGRKETYEKIRIENIRDEIRIFLGPRKKWILSRATFCKNYLTEEFLWKFALLQSDEINWDKYISFLHELFHDGLFHNFSFEDAVFVIFLIPIFPSTFYQVICSEKYKSELKFHVDCLAGAIRKWIESVKHVSIPDPMHPVQGKNLAEKIYNSYWVLIKKDKTPIEQIGGKVKKD